LKGSSPSPSAATSSKTKINLNLHRKSQQRKTNKRNLFLYLWHSLPRQVGSLSRSLPPRPGLDPMGSWHPPQVANSRTPQAAAPRPPPNPGEHRHVTAARGAGTAQAALRGQHRPPVGFAGTGGRTEASFPETNRLSVFFLAFPLVRHTPEARAFLLRRSFPRAPRRAQPF